MSEKYKFRNPDGIYFITPTIISWVDLFSKRQYRDVIIDSLKHCQQEKGLEINAWCIMSNHIHLIVSRKGEELLPSIIRDFKKYTSIKLIEKIREQHESRSEWMLKIFNEATAPIKRNKIYKVWQDGNHPVELMDNEMIDTRLEYLHMNPVKVGLVFLPEHYVYSSAIDYCGDSGFLSITKLI